MSTHNIGFYEDLTKLSLNFHQICTLSLLLDFLFHSLQSQSQIVANVFLCQALLLNIKQCYFFKIVFRLTLPDTNSLLILLAQL